MKTRPPASFVSRTGIRLALLRSLAKLLGVHQLNA